MQVIIFLLVNFYNSHDTTLIKILIISILKNSEKTYFELLYLAFNIKKMQNKFKIPTTKVENVLCLGTYMKKYLQYLGCPASLNLP